VMVEECTSMPGYGANLDMRIDEVVFCAWRGGDSNYELRSWKKEMGGGQWDGQKEGLLIEMGSSSFAAMRWNYSSGPDIGCGWDSHVLGTSTAAFQPTVT
jgi:hypothetical protein